MEESCLYAAMDCPRESHDRLLGELIAPIVGEIRGHGSLDSLFFVRYADPVWQLRFRVLGRPSWIEGEVRPRVASALRPFLDDGVIERVEFGEYAREWERYGGPEGMALAEKMFLHDSLACLELLDAEARGGTEKSRREYSLAFTELFLDVLQLDAVERLEFYREGHAWAFRDGVFRDEDRARLDRQYGSVRDGLREVLRGVRGGDPARFLGGAEPARIAANCLAAMTPVAEELRAAHAAGRIRQSLVYLAWSYAHLHCNRLGIDLVPEAILRYLMFRAHEDAASS